MDRSILKLLLYLSPFILAAVLGLVAGVISLWEKSGPGRRKQALNQKLRNKDRDEAIKRLDQQNKKDRNVLIQIVKDKKDETYIREQALIWILRISGELRYDTYDFADDEIYR